MECVSETVAWVLCERRGRLVLVRDRRGRLRAVSATEIESRGGDDYARCEILSRTEGSLQVRVGDRELWVPVASTVTNEAFTRGRQGGR